MSPRWFGLVMVIGLVLPGLLQAGEDKPIPAGKLIEQLGSNDFPQRERAQQALKARGIGVLPALRKALNHHDPEVRRRLEELIPVLEAVAALEPKRVTLGENLQTLSAVLDSITKQTGYTINLDDKDDGQLHSFAMKSTRSGRPWNRSAARRTGLSAFNPSKMVAFTSNGTRARVLLSSSVVPSAWR